MENENKNTLMIDCMRIAVDWSNKRKSELLSV